MEKLTHPLTLFWLCMLLHLIADYTLQGVLCDLKQREWWKEQIKKIYEKHHGDDKSLEWRYKLINKYSGDYLAGLGCHAAMWAIMTFVPLLLVLSPVRWSCLVIVNMVVHLVVDHFKANVHNINLRQDQLLHLAQIAGSVILVTI